MRYFMQILILVFAGLLAAPQTVAAAWGPWAPRAGEVWQHVPSCAKINDETVGCATLDGAGRVALLWLDGVALRGRAGSGATLPSCAKLDGQRVICASADNPFLLKGNVFDGATAYTVPLLAEADADQVRLGLLSPPSCVNVGKDEVLCVWRSLRGNLASNWTRVSFSNTGKPSGTTGLNSVLPVFPLVGDPSCASDDAGNAVCAGLSPKGSVVTVRWDGRTRSWSNPLDIGGRALFPPDCTDFYENGEVVCLAVGFDLRAFVTRYKGGAFVAASWTPWYDLGGTLAATPRCAPIAPSQLACLGVAATDNGVWATTYAKTWSVWRKVFGPVVNGETSCSPYAPGKVVCTIIDMSLNRPRTVIGP